MRWLCPCRWAEPTEGRALTSAGSAYSTLSPGGPGRSAWRSYVELARKTVPEGGHLVIATFADDGPKRCSDLDVCRYNARSLASELGEGFSFVREASETHATPWGSSQAFFYGVFRRQ